MKKVLWIILIIVLLGAGVIYYYINMPHRNIVDEQASIELQSEKIMAEYEDNVEAANDSYLDQVVAVSGVVSEMDEQSLVLDEVVYCSMDSTAQLQDIGEGATVTVKGRVIGFDELFGQVKLDNCVMVE